MNITRPNNDGHAGYSFLLWTAVVALLVLALLVGGFAWWLVDLVGVLG